MILYHGEFNFPFIPILNLKLLKRFKATSGSKRSIMFFLSDRDEFEIRLKKPTDGNDAKDPLSRN